MSKPISYPHTYEESAATGLGWVLLLAVIWVTGLFGTGAVEAADAPYPIRPVRFIVPTAVGGASDLISRVIGQKLAEGLGQPFVIDNRPGAGGNIGSEIIARAVPDGYTIGMGIVGVHSINPHLYRNMAFDSIRDFQPISTVATATQILVINTNVPARSVTELIALARAQPGELNFGSPGNGSTAHLAGALLESMAGIKITHVPFGGAAAARNAILAGDIQAAFELVTSVLPHIKSGRLRALAVSGLTRSPAVPDLPTASEAGVPGFDATSWVSVVGPAGLPPPIVEILNRQIRTILAQPETLKRLDEMGTVAAPSTPAELRQRMERDKEKWGQVIRASGAKLD